MSYWEPGAKLSLMAVYPLLNHKQGHRTAVATEGTVNFREHSWDEIKSRQMRSLLEPPKWPQSPTPQGQYK